MRQIASCILIAVAACSTRASEKVPVVECRLELAFETGQRGSQSFLDDLRTRLLERSREGSCVRLLDDEGGNAEASDLLLSVRLREPELGAVHEIPLADSVKVGGDPDVTSRWSARIQVDSRWELTVGAPPRIVKSGKAHVLTGQPADVFGHDPSEIVREQGIDALAEDVLRGVCRGSSASLKRRIDEVRTSSPETEH